jgi:hypothetical protein|nr:MAG TPA: hypothetical protein [Caudoviricetes sp.]DAN99973.1 MAG TPA: hypothetical protein [Caudoviricetes sp.]DAW59889.1 MAG TPA: hypothetical protein [Caudoviricetes sp.]
MAFNPYYQNPYYPQPMPDNLMQMRQQQMMQPAPPPVPQNPVATGGVQWVSSEQEARGYLIAPNSAVALWDSTAPTVYLKQSDASGKPTLKIYDLVERAETPRTAPQGKGVEFVTREEFDRLAALVGELKGKKKRKVEEDEDDE